MAKFSKKLSTKQFIISQLLILTLGLVVLGVLYYILNIQYQVNDKPFLGGPVTTLPKSLRLDLDEPADNSLVFQSSILVSGKTGASKDVLISTETQDQVIQSKSDGNFSSEINLDQGENVVVVVVFDTNGESRLVERTVFYSKEKL